MKDCHVITQYLVLVVGGKEAKNLMSVFWFPCISCVLTFPCLNWQKNCILLFGIWWTNQGLEEVMCLNYGEGCWSQISLRWLNLPQWGSTSFVVENAPTHYHVVVFPIPKNRKKSLTSGYEKGKLVPIFAIPFTTSSLEELFGWILEANHKSCLEMGPLDYQ